MCLMYLSGKRHLTQTMPLIMMACNAIYSKLSAYIVGKLIGYVKEKSIVFW